MDAPGLWTLSATTIPGLEPVAVQEIREITGREAWSPRTGRVALRGREEDVFSLNYCARSLHRVVLQLGEYTVHGLEDVYDAVESLGLADLLATTQSFAVRAERHGAHGFGSMDAERMAGQAVIDAFLRRGRPRPPVDLNRPDVLVTLEIRGERVRVGIDTTGARSLHRRGYGALSHPAPLKSSLAYGLVRLSGWRPEELLLDPMCGSGTVCIEASLWANRVPHWFRQDLAFHRLGFLNQDRFREMQRRVDAAVTEKPLRIRGADISAKHALRAEENARRAGAVVEVMRADATRTPLIGDRIVTNPPYGRRMGRRSRVEALYTSFLDRLFRHAWKRTVILTARPELFPVPTDTKRIHVRFGNLSAAVLILEGSSP